MRKRATAPHLVLAAMLLMVTAVMCQSHSSANDDASQQPTGQITGNLTDRATGDPVIGASVQIMGTTMGVQSGYDGTYTILQVLPGTYRLKIAAVGYGTVELADVLVVADSATKIDVQLDKSAQDLGVTIEVRAKRDIVEKSGVSNTTTINKEIIQSAPVTTVEELLSQAHGEVSSQSGEVVIRGGRADEVAKIVGESKTLSLCAPSVSDRTRVCPPAHGGTAIVNGEAFDAMFFKNYGVNPFVDTEDDHFSTFAIDVDDASFIVARAYLERGEMPPNEAIRTEEFINHFDYDYKSPENDAFAIHVDGAPSVFGPAGSYLLRVGIKGFAIAPAQRKAANLVFVIDVSGSMSREDRLELVKRALRALVDELKPRDRVGIVVYGSCGRVVLEPTGLEHKRTILGTIERLVPDGATNAEEGLMLGYEMANRCFEIDKINRIILCSDGVANVGMTGPAQILKQIKRYADRGITLSAIGFGMGNFNDILMEQLGNKGNGHYAYVDDFQEAKRVFVDNLTGMLQVIARDVKIQVDFDSESVRSYRLLGYENRDVADKDFRVDTVDGGEIGSGHQVTALYELKLHKQSRTKKLATVNVRYKDPDDIEEVTEVRTDIHRSDLFSDFEEASAGFRLAAAAAEFAEILRKSYWAKESNLENVLDLIDQIKERRRSPEVIELLSLVSRAQELDNQLARR